MSADLVSTVVKIKSSTKWRRVDWYLVKRSMEVLAASIFSEYSTAFITLTMEAESSSENSATITNQHCVTSQRHQPSSATLWKLQIVYFLFRCSAHNHVYCKVRIIVGIFLLCYSTYIAQNATGLKHFIACKMSSATYYKGVSKIFRTDAVKIINLTTKRVWKLSNVHPASATWHTDSLYMVVLPSTGASRYHDCCIDGGTVRNILDIPSYCAGMWINYLFLTAVHHPAYFLALAILWQYRHRSQTVTAFHQIPETSRPLAFYSHPEKPVTIRPILMQIFPSTSRSFQV
jgi:hypothetical protein